MKKILLLLVAFSMITAKAKADEGMWLLPFLKNLNYKDMQKAGVKISAEDIYSINNSSIKDAILIFGGGCTGEVISDQGLVLTNHHCGFGSIQQHSSIENDYLKDGFWAMKQSEELPTPGLSVTFIKEIQDVTKEVLKGTKDSQTEDERKEAISNAIKTISKKATEQFSKKYKGISVSVREFFGGNQYILFVSQRYPDVRMVGAPPSSIGKFGGDTDNWMWPRHTGDFSLFRIYADKDGNPASYSAENTPLKPVKSLPISIKGVKENDFAMIIGFPGATQRYMTSYELDERMNITNKNRIHIRGIRLNLLMEDMSTDPKVKIQYASKYAGSSNYWKNSIGMNQALTKLNVKSNKQDLEKQFTDWANSDPKLKAKYGEALELIKKAVTGRWDLRNAASYYSEAITSSIELASIASSMAVLTSTPTQKQIEGLKSRIESFYKDYNLPTDKKVALAMINDFNKNVTPQYQLKELNDLIAKYGSAEKLVEQMYTNSPFVSKEKALEFVSNPDLNTLKEDIAYIIGTSARKNAQELNKQMASFNEMYNKGNRLFIAGLLEMNKDKSYYPDANSTIRLTYGKVLPYEPRDGVVYNYATTLKGVIEKEDPNNQYEFSVPEKLKELYKNKDYGQYAANGEDVVTCFIADLDITGGNSGSPTINANGELIGSAFDGNWEAMSGDIDFEENMQRCIIVDIRYVLFIIDKYAGATNLINEMNIVK